MRKIQSKQGQQLDLRFEEEGSKRALGAVLFFDRKERADSFRAQSESEALRRVLSHANALKRRI